MAEVATQTRPAGPAQRSGVGGYRPDIDGLRGVAVIMVVLWRAGVRALPGGYAGVDVFFVISGYVITGSLQRDAGAGGISILRFYERRLRPIAPAFLAMLAVVLAAGFVIQLPAELTRTAGVALGALGLSANLVLWRQGRLLRPRRRHRAAQARLEPLDRAQSQPLLQLGDDLSPVRACFGRSRIHRQSSATTTPSCWPNASRSAPDERHTAAAPGFAPRGRPLRRRGRFPGVRQAATAIGSRR